MHTNNTQQLQLPNEISQKLRLLRRQSSLTRKGLAEISGIGQDTIRSWEMGARTPTLANLIGLLDVYKKRGIIIDSTDWFTNQQSNLDIDNNIKEEDKTSELLFYDKETFKLACMQTMEIVNKQNNKYTILEVFSELLTRYNNIALKKESMRERNE